MKAKFLGWQEDCDGKKTIELFNLLEPVSCYPAGSTLARGTLEALGVDLPSRAAERPVLRCPERVEEEVRDLSPETLAECARIKTRLAREAIRKEVAAIVYSDDPRDPFWGECGSCSGFQP